jgi:hypothetical protein
MSFYINVELELYPGTSPNLFQKSVIKCQSTFERIREAYADLFGYQYRPAPMSEAYTYSVTKQPPVNGKQVSEDKKEEDKKGEENKKGGKKSKTLKGRMRRRKKGKSKTLKRTKY